MNDSHERLRNLVLSIEELEGPNLEQARGHLGGCQECRQLLDELRDLERQVREMTGIPMDESDPLREMDQGIREGARASHQALIDRVEIARSGRREGSSRRRARLMPLLPLLAAASLAAVLLWPRSGAEDWVRSVELTRPTVTRDASDRAWRDGDSFVIQVELARASYPIVLSVGESGRPELLHPESADHALEVMVAGEQLQLPAASSGEVWAFEGRGTLESLIIGFAATPHLDLRSLMSRLVEVSAAESSRESSIQAMQSYLEETVGPSVRRDVTLAP